MSRYLIAVVVVLAALSSPRPAAAAEPGWVGQVVKPRSERAKIRQTPMIHRPYRPLHFYGNTVRRMHACGSSPLGETRRRPRSLPSAHAGQRLEYALSHGCTVGGDEADRSAVVSELIALRGLSTCAVSDGRPKQRRTATASESGHQRCSP